MDRPIPQPIVMGRHLLDLGVPPGPEIGYLLDDCFEAQLDGLFSDLDGGLTFIKAKLATQDTADASQLAQRLPYSERERADL